jgi:hypothetical protein
MDFPREMYYSQTEALKIYKISAEDYKELIKDLPQINKKIDLGGYQVITIYVLRELIDNLNLKKR